MSSDHLRRLSAMSSAMTARCGHAADSSPAAAMNEQIIVERLPKDALSADCFRLQRVVAPTAASLKKGEVLCETIAFVVAAGQRAGLQGSASYAGAPVTGVVMGGSSVSRVVASNDPSVSAGALVSSNGWQRFTVQKAASIVQYEEGDDGLDPAHHIGVLGTNGLTAYFGLLDIGKPKPGETVVVSGAAGSVGHLVCQLAKNLGCRVVGVAGEWEKIDLLGPLAEAGSDDKCNILRSDLGVDATVNYKSPNFRKEFAAACPNKIDVYFDNTGGPILQTALFNMATHGRIVCCGNVSQYDTSSPGPGPRGVPGLLVNNRVTMQGFLVSDWSGVPAPLNKCLILPRVTHLRSRLIQRDHFYSSVQAEAAAAKAELRKMIVSGALRPWVNRFQGLEKGPEAFVGMLNGGNLGTTTVVL